METLNLIPPSSIVKALITSVLSYSSNSFLLVSLGAREPTSSS